MPADMLRALREEFPPIDLGYCRKFSPELERLAKRYNDARRAIDPEDEKTIELARSRKIKALDCAAEVGALKED